MSKKPKTSGLEWLVYSLMAFNGSGYADMNSPDDFLDSYVAYCLMRKRSQAVNLVTIYRLEVLPTIEGLLERTYGAGRQPSEKNLVKFQQFKKTYQSRLL